MANNNHNRKRIHEYLREMKSNNIGQPLSSGVVNNEESKVPASLYGERSDSLTDMHDTIERDFGE